MRILLFFLGTPFLLGILTNNNPAWCKAPPNKIAVIVSKDWNEIKTIKPAELKQIYLKKTMTFAGRKVKPINFAAGSKIRSKFNQEILGMSENELSNYWIKQGLKGGAKPPKSFSSNQTILIFVSQIKGAIGYMNYGDLTGQILRKVKVVATEP